MKSGLLSGGGAETSNVRTDGGVAGPDGTLWGLVMSHFGLAGDPFTQGFVDGRKELYTRQAAASMSTLLRETELASEARSDLLLVGTEGSGKTTLLRSLLSSLSQAGRRATYVDARTEGEKSDASGKARLGRLREAARGDLSRREGVVLLDNSDALAGEMLRERNAFPPARRRSTVVMAMTYSTYLSVPRVGPAALFVPLHDPKGLARMLRDSIQASASGTVPFEPGAYLSVSERSLGLPGLAVSLAKYSMLAAYQVGMRSVTCPLVERVSRSLRYDAAWKLLNGEPVLPYRRFTVLREVLKSRVNSGMSNRNDLYKAMGYPNASALDYQVKKLVAAGLLIPDRNVWRVVYEIPKPVRAAFDLLEVKRATSTEVWLRSAQAAEPAPVPSATPVRNGRRHRRMVHPATGVLSQGVSGTAP